MLWRYSGVTEDELLKIAAMDSDYCDELILTSKHDPPLVEGSLCSIRALDERPHVYLAVEEYDDLCRLLSDSAINVRKKIHCVCDFQFQ